MSDFDKFVDSLVDDESDLEELKAEPVKAPHKYSRKQFECEACGGSGLWRSGKRNSHGNAKCNTCHGKGYLVTSPAQRAKAKAKLQARKTDARDANLEHGNGLLHKWLSGMVDWNEFARSMIEQHDKGKAWSEKQVEACRRMYVKMKAKESERATERESEAEQVDLEPIRRMFETARANGHKKPVYRAEGLIINRAPDHGKNPGALYVKNESYAYGGKVLETTFHPSREGKEQTFTPNGNAYDALMIIAENPYEAAVRYGRKTGQCACCGRELTNALSIQLGIGPICREKWGFMFADETAEPVALIEDRELGSVKL